MLRIINWILLTALLGCALAHPVVWSTEIVRSTDAGWKYVERLEEDPLVLFCHPVSEKSVKSLQLNSKWVGIPDISALNSRITIELFEEEALEARGGEAWLRRPEIGPSDKGKKQKSGKIHCIKRRSANDKHFLPHLNLRVLFACTSPIRCNEIPCERKVESFTGTNTVLTAVVFFANSNTNLREATYLLAFIALFCLLLHPRIPRS